MKAHRKLFLFPIPILILFVSLIACTADQTPLTDEEKVEQVTLDYYQALQEENIETALSLVYGYEQASEEKKESLRQNLENVISAGGEQLKQASFSVKQVGFPEKNVAVAIITVESGEAVSDSQQFLVNENDSWKIDIASTVY
jgi:hypothetical protein